MDEYFCMEEALFQDLLCFMKHKNFEIFIKIYIIDPYTRILCVIKLHVDTLNYIYCLHDTMMALFHSSCWRYISIAVVISGRPCNCAIL